LDACSIADKLGIAITLVMEQLLLAEQQGLLCRDDSLEGALLLFLFLLLFCCFCLLFVFVCCCLKVRVVLLFVVVCSFLNQSLF
jgi:hypothetical protein